MSKVQFTFQDGNVWVVNLDRATLVQTNGTKGITLFFGEFTRIVNITTLRNMMVFDANADDFFTIIPSEKIIDYIKDGNLL